VVARSSTPSEPEEPLISEWATRDCAARHDPIGQRRIVVRGVRNDEIKRSAGCTERYQHIGALQGRSVGEFERLQIRLNDGNRIARTFYKQCMRRAAAQGLNANGAAPRAEISEIRATDSRLKYRKE
jgi:hypothetical protein